MGVCQTKRASWYDNTNKLLYSLCLTTPSGFGGANTTGAFQILMRRLARLESTLAGRAKAMYGGSTRARNADAAPRPAHATQPSLDPFSHQTRPQSDSSRRLRGIG